MIELQNGCEVLREAPHRAMEDTMVVIARENGPLKVVCWVVDAEGNAFWGAYGKEAAESAWRDRVKVQRYNVVVTVPYMLLVEAGSEEEAEGLALQISLTDANMMDDVSAVAEAIDE